MGRLKSQREENSGVHLGGGMPSSAVPSGLFTTSLVSLLFTFSRATSRDRYNITYKLSSTALN